MPFVDELTISQHRFSQDLWTPTNLHLCFVLHFPSAYVNHSEEDGDHEEKKIWYYSTKSQLEELMDCLDTEYWEMDLHAALVEMKEEVQGHMAITEELTNKARGNSKTYLTALNGTRFIFSTITIMEGKSSRCN